MSDHMHRALHFATCIGGTGAAGCSRPHAGRSRGVEVLGHFFETRHRPRCNIFPPSAAVLCSRRCSPGRVAPVPAMMCRRSSAERSAASQRDSSSRRSQSGIAGQARAARTEGNCPASPRGGTTRQARKKAAPGGRAFAVPPRCGGLVLPRSPSSLLSISAGASCIQSGRHVRRRMSVQPASCAARSPGLPSMAVGAGWGSGLERWGAESLERLR